MQLALKDEEKLRRLDIASRVVMKYGPLYSRSITSEMLREILKEVSGSDDFTLWKFRSVKASHINDLGLPKDGLSIKIPNFSISSITSFLYKA